MKTRIVHTSLYSDEKVESLSKDATWLFVFLITCPYIGLTGVFQLTDKRLGYEAKLTPKELENAKNELKDMVVFHKSWIRVKNTEKYHNFQLSQTTKKAYDRELEAIPEVIRKSLYSIDTVSTNPYTVSGISDTPISNKSKVISNKQETKKTSQPTLTGYEKSLVDNLPESEMKSISDKKKVSLELVESYKEGYVLWVQGKPEDKERHNRNMSATVKSWLNRDIASGKVQTKKSFVEKAMAELGEDDNVNARII